MQYRAENGKMFFQNDVKLIIILKYSVLLTIQLLITLTVR